MSRGLVLVPYTGHPVATCLFSVIDEQLRVSRVKFSYLLFNNASLFGRFHGWDDYWCHVICLSDNFSVAKAMVCYTHRTLTDRFRNFRNCSAIPDRRSN